ncbi:MAG: hypothetical protein AAF213_02095 [Pseudomonadota bacterium]
MRQSDLLRHSVRRGFGVAIGALGLAGAAGGVALILASGPKAPAPEPANDAQVQIEPDPLAVGSDAPVHLLGDPSHDDWRKGRLTRFVVGDTDSLPALEIDASQIESGRYFYPGDLTINGSVTMPYVEFTAASITVTGSVTADHVTLTGIEQPGENYDPQFRDIYSDNYYLHGWKRRYDRGDVSVEHDVMGDNIMVTGGEISIGGDADGLITLSASQGEIGDVVVRNDYRGDYRDTVAMREDAIPADHYREFVRYSAGLWQDAITIGGTVGEDVVQQTTRDLTRQQEQAAGVVHSDPMLPSHLLRYGEPSLRQP